jgi:hypothetical protein
MKELINGAVLFVTLNFSPVFISKYRYDPSIPVYHTVCILSENTKRILNKFGMCGSTPKVVEKPEGKRPIGLPRRRWVDNIKTDLREIG